MSAKIATSSAPIAPPPGAIVRSVPRPYGRRSQLGFVQGFEDIRNDYSAAKQSRYRRRRTGIPSGGSHADFHYRSEADFLRMMEYARDFDRCDIVVGQMVDRAVTNTIQGGFTLDPATGDEKLDLDLWNFFNDWATDPDQCDSAGEMTFAEMEEKVLRTQHVDGDIFGNPLSTGALQLIEAHRCRTPKGTQRNVVHGVLLDSTRRRLEYWFTKEEVDLNRSVQLVSDMHRVSARNEDGHKMVFHILNPKRITQTRGITSFAPMFDALGMFEDISFAKMLQQQIVSCIAFLRNRTENFSAAVSGQTGERETEVMPDGHTRIIDGISPGLELTSAPGETITGFSPNVPNAEFFPHVRLILTLIGVNLGMPLVMLLMDASETNFSGWRGAIDQARMGFRRNQKRLIERFHAPVYRWKLRQWMDEDPALEAAFKNLGARAFFNHKWNPPSWPYIQPLDDAQADALMVKTLQTSPRRSRSARGEDHDDIIHETIADNGSAIEKAIKRAQEITSRTGVPVTWREVLFLTEGQLMQIQQSSESREDSGKQTPSKKSKEAARAA